MKAAAGIPLVLLAAGLLVLGVAWGAATQHETFLGQQAAEQEASGSLVVLTAFFCGLGAALAALALGSAPLLRRIGAALQAGGCTWLLVALIQADFPNYDVIDDLGIATIGQSTLVLEGQGAPTVLLPILAGGLLGLWGVIDGFRRALGSPRSARSLHSEFHHLLGTIALAAPFLLIVPVGAVRVMLSIPASEPGAGLAYAILPLAGFACLALAVLLVLRAWNLANLLQEPRLLPFTREVWRTLGRIEWAALGLLMLTAVLASALPATDTAATGLGRTFVLTLRSHGQGLLFAAVPLIPAMLAHRRISGQLDGPVDATPDVVKDAVAMTVAVGLAALGAVLGNFSGLGLLPWILAFIPVAIVAGARLPSLAALPVMLLAGWTFWGRGNTIIAAYNADTFPTLVFDTHPALLGLWRIGGALLAAWAVTRVGIHLGAGTRARLVIPLALLLALGVLMVTLLEVPLWAWDESRNPVNKLAVGSLIRSQSVAVRALAHIVSTLASLGGALAAARLLRPEWFVRRPAPTPVASATPA